MLDIRHGAAIDAVALQTQVRLLRSFLVCFAAGAECGLPAQHKHCGTAPMLPQGPNGRLPNLDLVNTLARTARLPVMLSAPPQPCDKAAPVPLQQSPEAVWQASALRRSLGDLVPRNYGTHLTGLTSFAADLAWGPVAPHGPLLQYNIDAVTVRGTRVSGARVGMRPAARRCAITSAPM